MSRFSRVSIVFIPGFRRLVVGGPFRRTMHREKVRSESHLVTNLEAIASRCVYFHTYLHPSYTLGNYTGRQHRRPGLAVVWLEITRCVALWSLFGYIRRDRYEVLLVK